MINPRRHVLPFLLMLGLALPPLVTAQEGVTTQPEEAARIQQQLQRFQRTRKDVARQIDTISTQLEELKTYMTAMEDQELEMQVQIDRLLGDEEFLLNRQRRDLRQWVQWGLVILTGGVTFIFFKIRRSRLREAARLEKYRQQLADARRVD